MAWCFFRGIVPTRAITWITCTLRLQEREKTIGFVVEEVERVKALFEEKETQVTAERDAALAAAKDASQQAAAAQQQAADAAAALAAAESRLAAASADAEVRPCLVLRSLLRSAGKSQCPQRLAETGTLAHVHDVE